MKTVIITENISSAAAIICGGGLVAVPTETVYGLAGNGLDEAAVQQIYEVKGRPEVKALSLMVADSTAMEQYCTEVPKAAYALVEKYWPGPLTIILKSKGREPAVVRAGGETVGLRCPDHPLTLRLLREAGVPLAAPSANPSGKPSPKNAAQVLAYFDGKIDAVIDGGECGIGRESTILDMSRTPYRVLRVGALSEAEVFDTLRRSVTLIGITGGTGCGKTTALNVLRDKGVLILDCDEIYHGLTVSCVPMREEIIARFGEVYDGMVLNRKKLGDIVFSDSRALLDLNGITHKYVCLELDRLLEEYAVNGGTLAAIDAIGLLDIDYGRRTLCNVAVTAPLEERVKRLMKRDGITEDYARQRIAAQKPGEYFESHCDFTLCNDRDKADFEQKCIIFFTEVLENAGEGKRRAETEEHAVLCAEERL